MLLLVFSVGIGAYDEDDLKKLKANKDCLKCDLSGAYLAGENLSYANLSFADLTDANLDSANLERTNLTKEKLEGTGKDTQVVHFIVHPPPPPGG